MVCETQTIALQHYDLDITYTFIFTSEQVRSLTSLVIFPFIQTLLPSASSGYTIIRYLSFIYN